MGRHSENSSDLIYLKFPCLQKLCFVRRDGNRSIFHALFQDGNLVAVGRTAEGGVPGITHPCRVFQRSRMLQHTAGSCSVGIELTAVFLRRNCQTDGVLRHGDKIATQHRCAAVRTKYYSFHVLLFRDNIPWDSTHRVIAICLLPAETAFSRHPQTAKYRPDESHIAPNTGFA